MVNGSEQENMEREMIPMTMFWTFLIFLSQNIELIETGVYLRGNFWQIMFSWPDEIFNDQKDQTSSPYHVAEDA